MNWTEIVMILIQIVIIGLMVMYKRHIEESVKTLHMRDQSYQSKMGDYDALKESLDTILKDVEHMKSGVAYEEQRRHHWIESRNQKLILFKINSWKGFSQMSVQPFLTFVWIS